MFPRVNRLPPHEIRFILARGRRIATKELQIAYTRTNRKNPRLAVVVPLKLDKRATARNRMKRLLRESLRVLLPRIVPYDAVVTARAGLGGRSHDEVLTIVTSALIRASVLIRDTVNELATQEAS